VFLRFVTGDVHAVSRQPRGVFQSAYDLADSSDVDGWYRDALWDELSWFEVHLPIPPRERFVKGRGISWFHSGAQRSISRLWSVIAILREHGVGVRQIRTRHPGRVVYEDRLQIVAVPWRDTARRILKA
jgi:hypothetical protein